MVIKTSRVLLESAARTATTATAKQTDKVCTAVRLYLDVSVASGTGGLQPVIRGYDKASGHTVSLTTGGAAVTSTGTYCYELGIGIGTSASSVKERVLSFLPETWDVNVTAGDSSSYTYSLSVEVLQP